MTATINTHVPTKADTMTFKLPVNLYALRTRHTLKAALKAKPRDVERRFNKVPTNLSCSFAELVAWTIDTGYGSTQDQTACLSLTAPEQGELHCYLRRRLSMLIQLVQLNSSKAFVSRNFARVLDSSEKADASFILGGLACRLAHEKWFQQRGVKVTRFWHLSVYEKHAASWISSTAYKGKSRPDFLVQDSTGKWFPAEAKGSFDNADWGAIQRGLQQAAQLKSVTFVDPTTFTNSTQSVADFSCVMGHFATSSEFESSLVDPPADIGANLTLELAPEFADANTFLAAIRQYRILGRRRGPMNPQVVSDFLGYATCYLGPDTFFGKPLMIGIPMILLESERQLNAFMLVAQHFNGAFCDYFRRRLEKPESDDVSEWDVFLARQSPEVALNVTGIDDAEVHRQAYRMFALAVGYLASSAEPDLKTIVPPATWGMAMLQLEKVPMFLSGDQNISLQQWLEKLRLVIRRSDFAARLEADFGRTHVESQPGVSVASSLNGLIVIHGAAPRHVWREAKKFKT